MASNDVLKAIRELVADYTAAVKDRDGERYSQLFEEDVTWLQPGAAAVTHRNGIRDAIAATFQRARMNPSIEVESLDVSGDLAATCVHDAGQIVRPDGTEATMNVGEIWVLKNRNGRWRIARQIWNSRSQALS